jgi:hypothetical protein
LPDPGRVNRITGSQPSCSRRHQDDAAALHALTLFSFGKAAQNLAQREPMIPFGANPVPHDARDRQ